MNDTIQDELDNYSYHTSFESSQTESGYANSNYLVHTSAAATIHEDVSISQLNMNNLTPKSWINHQHIAQQSNKLPHHQIIRKCINFDNLTIIRQNSLNGEIRSKNFSVSSNLELNLMTIN